MERGLRQGDLLAPFLFVVVADVLNRLMSKAVNEGLIEGIIVGRQGVSLSHLQFADDTILFVPAKANVLVNVRRILDCFGLMSGLRINFDKSALIPMNCNERLVTELNSKLQCQVLALPIKYLGIPLGANPRRMDTWEPIIEKIRKMLSGWKGKLLSRAGRLTLIKSVWNNLPMYYLGLFKMPKKVVQKIILLQNKFLWGMKEVGRSIPLVKWEIVQRPKKLGGLGVGDIIIKNAALLFKWWWRFSTKELPLWKHVVASCHNLQVNIMMVDETQQHYGGLWGTISNVWKTDDCIKKLVLAGITRVVGNGEQTRFWEDTWCG